MRFLWLHGFASAPTSTKARYMQGRLETRGIALEIPDLNAPAFRDLTVTRMLEKLDELSRGEQVVLFGSSLGGFTAATYAARRPGQVASAVLLAPAFDLAARWQARMPEAELRRWREQGVFAFDHYAYGRKEDLSIRFLEDAASYEPFPLPAAEILVLQGTRDEVVDPALAREFSSRMRGRARLVELDDGHELTKDLDRLWRESESHLAPFLGG
jgi:alpha-beta hydrolase superfamily lysophospholipase